MKQKTFEMDTALARQFEDFCARHMLIEKRAAAAAILYFVGLDAIAREQAVLALDKFLHQRPDAKGRAS